MFGRHVYYSRAGEQYLFVDAAEWRAAWAEERRHAGFEQVSRRRAEKVLRELARERRPLLRKLFDDFTLSRLTQLDTRQQLERLLRGLGRERSLGDAYPPSARFYVLRRPFPQWAASGAPPLPEMPPEAPFDPQTQPTFIDLRLVERFGNPQTDVNYELTDAAGAKHAGSFAGEAKVHIEPIEPGLATLDLPGTYPGDWKLRGAPPDGYKRIELELRILDDRARPLKGAGFELKYDAGQSHSGKLDDAGKAKLRDIPSGRFALVVSGYDPLDYTQLGDSVGEPPAEATHASPKLLGLGVRGETGTQQTLVVHHPKQPLYSVDGAGFAFGSSFPGIQVLAALGPMLQLAAQHPDRKLMCFGHTDEEGSEDVNKKESDLRATALYALLTSDQSAFDELDNKDKWSLIHYQEMLTALGFKMPIDDEPGPKTKKGATKFQKAYNEGQFQERGDEGELKPPSPKLGVDGLVGPKTKAAVREAYLFAFGAKLPAERFFSTPKAGCSEFNLRGNPDADRRVSLALIDEATAPASVPCAEGNAGACPVDEAKGGVRCRFYTRWFEDEGVVGGGEDLELPDVGDDVVVVLWNAHAFESTDRLRLEWKGGTASTRVVDSDESTVVLEGSGVPAGQLLALNTNTDGGSAGSDGSSGTSIA